ncbi:MAG: hypothetical protein H6668_25275 [Ardenticatenaceae bacterium]|nr:hypothetical protein [Ardenticatenaceae bacterium]
MSSEFYISIIFAAAALGLAIWLLWWQAQKAAAVIDEWAKANGYTILHRELRLFRQGPFFLRAGRNHRVYFLEVLDEIGLRRKVFLRVGDFWGRMRLDSVKVAWVD